MIAPLGSIYNPRFPRATKARFCQIQRMADFVLQALAPVIPEPAPPLEAVKAGTVEEIVSRMGRFSRLTRPFNGLGLPALSVPCGFSGDGRPLAVQIVGRPFDEATVLRLGHAYERATDWGARRPALA